MLQPLRRIAGRKPILVVKSIEPRITEAALEALSVERSVESRASYGGTAPVRVREQVVLEAVYSSGIHNANTMVINLAVLFPLPGRK